MSDLETRLAAVEQRIANACNAAGRPRDQVRMLAVSKTRPAELIRALAASGLTAFGENHVDEALAKQPALVDLPLEWHFIGPLQSNKSRSVAGHFDWIHSVDRIKLVRRLADQRPADLNPLNVLIQVNIDAEPQKAGCTPGGIDALAAAVAERDRLRLRGLMAIPDGTASAEATRASFARMRELFNALKRDHPGCDTLSMGMSADLEIAIAEGSTLVRVGTALFGPRDPVAGANAR